MLDKRNNFDWLDYKNDRRLDIKQHEEACLPIILDVLWYYQKGTNCYSLGSAIVILLICSLLPWPKRTAINIPLRKVTFNTFSSLPSFLWDGIPLSRVTIIDYALKMSNCYLSLMIKNNNIRIFNTIYWLVKSCPLRLWQFVSFAVSQHYSPRQVYEPVRISPDIRYKNIR